MILKEFVDNFINHNSLVRLVYKIPGGNKVVLNTWDEVSMAWEISKGEGKYAPYINHQVIYITDISVSGKYSDISVSGKYSEAINIVIEEIPLDVLRELKLKELGI
jgi:hypothetical protein